tara:strand:- start:190 stop:447 length:258 start_codon:yes stop_codon:yes gene_type:complete
MKNDHGSHAKVGDYVQLISPAGDLCNVFGIVYKVEMDSLQAPSRDRYLRVYGQSHRIRDSFVRVISFAADEKADLDSFGSDLADV